MKYLAFLCLACGFLLGVAAEACAQPPPEDPVHNELRAVRDGVMDAVNKNDRDRLLTYLHKNIVVTFMDGETVRGPDGVRAYYDKMMTGPNKIVDTVTIKPTVDELSIIYGGATAVAFGSSDDDFKLKRGLSFHVRNRWTATVVKEDGKWLIAAFHASTGLFDNPLLNSAKRTVYWTGGIVGVVALLLGWWLGRRGRAKTA